MRCPRLGIGNLSRFAAAAFLAAILALAAAGAPARAQSLEAEAPQEVLRSWYGLVLKLVRHTPTYSPPVASRSFAYLGVAAFEAAAGGAPGLRSLAGQLNGLQPAPTRRDGEKHDEALVMHGVMARSVSHFFSNTGPTGQRAIAQMAQKLGERLGEGVEPELAARSIAYGEAVADHVLAWSFGDGGAVVENMGFPLEFEPNPDPARWAPTSLIRQQQAPLLPRWGDNRPFAMAKGDSCEIPPPPEYSEAEGSQFLREAMEVYETSKALTPEQREIARFWSDDPMLSPTPPGHWIFITLDILERADAGLEDTADVLARLGIGMADAFIGCWRSKFLYDLVRPVTYIRRLIDQKWEPLLITPPFPEYPSGHSTQSGAAAAVLEDFFGADFPFVDRTHERDGLPARSYSGFAQAAREAALSRLYGGIHFRSAIERGLEQGRCVARWTAALETRRQE